jgi:hypothetical protein
MLWEKKTQKTVNGSCFEQHFPRGEAGHRGSFRDASPLARAMTREAKGGGEKLVPLTQVSWGQPRQAEGTMRLMPSGIICEARTGGRESSDS